MQHHPEGLRLHLVFTTWASVPSKRWGSEAGRFVPGSSSALSVDTVLRLPTQPSAVTTAVLRVGTTSIHMSCPRKPCHKQPSSSAQSLCLSGLVGLFSCPCSQPRCQGDPLCDGSECSSAHTLGFCAPVKVTKENKKARIANYSSDPASTFDRTKGLPCSCPAYKAHQHQRDKLRTKDGSARPEGWGLLTYLDTGVHTSTASP